MKHPSASRRLATASCRIAAALACGLVALRAQEVDERFRMTVEVPGVELSTGSQFEAAVRLSADVGNIQGWSFAIENDPAALEFQGAVIGETTAGIRGGAGPEFLVVNEEPAGGSGVTMAVVFAFATPVFLDAGEDYELLRASYRVTANPAAADPCEPLVASVAFSDRLGEPPVSNVLTVDGATVNPSLTDGDITVRCPGTLEFTRCEGDTENVYLEWTFGGAPEWPFLALFRDDEFLALLEPDATSYDDLGLEPGSYQYTLATIVVDEPGTPTLVFASCTGVVIPVTVTSLEPGSGYYAGGTTVTVRGTAFTTAETTSLVFFAEGDEPIPLEIVEVVSAEEITAITPASPRLGVWSLRLENERGSAELPDAFEYGFIRGEVNSDAVLDISDGIIILEYLFLGADEPVCLDAVDTTDDGQHDVSDAIRILGFLFLGGPAPAAPYPEPGRDPTTRDPFSCLE